MERGYVKFWRMSEDSEVFASSDLWRLWSWCLFRANFKKRFVPFKTGKGEVTVKLDPGQFIFGRSKAAESLGWSASTVWKRMKRLESIGNIAIESNRQYSIVSICNWEQYQDSLVEKVTGKEQPSDRQGTAKEQPSDTDKNDKKEKKEKKTKDIVEEPPRPQIPYSQIVSFLNEKAGTKYKPTTNKTKSLIKARFNEGFSLEDFKSVIETKCDEWLTDDKMVMYLRPETLFSNKFEGYLQASFTENTTKKKEWIKHEIPKTTAYSD